MASVNENGTGMVMPVAPTGNGGGMFGGGFDGWWIILFIIILMSWGNNGNNGNNGNYNGYNTASEIQAGFNQAALQSGIAAVQTSLCNGFAGVTAAVNNAFNQSTIANMQQNFAIQQGLSNCCCENRAAIADLKYTVATENCADRQAVNDALVTLGNQFNAGIQSLKDEFCADRLAHKDEIIANRDLTIAELRAQINELSRQASTNAQTATILANNEAQTTALEQYLAPVARPAYIVQNPNCCAQNYACGCSAA